MSKFYHILKYRIFVFQFEIFKLQIKKVCAQTTNNHIMVPDSTQFCVFDLSYIFKRFHYEASDKRKNNILSTYCDFIQQKK